MGFLSMHRFYSYFYLQVKLSDENSVVGDDYKSNSGSTAVDCKADTTTSTGTDSFEWICDSRIAASKVLIQANSGSAPTTDLAEVVVVGFEWGEFLLIILTLFYLARPYPRPEKSQPLIGLYLNSNSYFASEGYPCAKGYSSTDGTNSVISGNPKCIECRDGK